MDSAIRIADGVHWIGVNDRTTDLFESIWPLPRGVSYNSYAIVDDKVAIIDAVKKTMFDLLLRKIKEVLPPGRGVDYLIVNHMEPDHSGSIALLREIFPAMTIIGNKKTLRFLKAFHGIEENVQAVADGLADGAGVDSLVLAFMLEAQPDLPIRTIDRSPAFAIPPVVASPHLPAREAEEIQRLLLGLADDPAALGVLEAMGVDRFVTIEDAAYESVRGLLAEFSGA